MATGANLPFARCIGAHRNYIDLEAVPHSRESLEGFNPVLYIYTFIQFPESNPKQNTVIVICNLLFLTNITATENTM